MDSLNTLQAQFCEMLSSVARSSKFIMELSKFSRIIFKLCPQMFYVWPL